MVTEWSRPNTRSYECRAAHLGRSNHGEEFGSIMPTDRDWVPDVVTGYNTDIDTCTITKGSTNKISAGQSLELHRAQKARAQSAERRAQSAEATQGTATTISCWRGQKAKPDLRCEVNMQGKEIAPSQCAQRGSASTHNTHLSLAQEIGPRGRDREAIAGRNAATTIKRATAVDIRYHCREGGTRQIKVVPCRTTCSHVSMTKCLDRRRALLVNAEGAAKAEQHAYQR